MVVLLPLQMLVSRVPHRLHKTHTRNVQWAQTHGTEQAVLAEPEEVQQMADMDASRQDKGPMEGMFSLRVFQYAPCGTYLIARSGTYTVKDCRTEQRARWDKIRWRAHMQREKEEREATVQRWKERKRMQREDKDVVDGMMADGRVPDDGP